MIEERVKDDFKMLRANKGNTRLAVTSNIDGKPSALMGVSDLTRDTLSLSCLLTIYINLVLRITNRLL